MYVCTHSKYVESILDKIENTFKGTFAGRKSVNYGFRMYPIGYSLWAKNLLCVLKSNA